MFSLRALLIAMVLFATLLQTGTAAMAQEETPERYIQAYVDRLPLNLSPAASFEQRLLASGMARLYAPAGYMALWQDRERFTQLLQELEQTADDGLTPELYGLAALRQWTPADNDTLTPQQQACRDLLATRAYLLALTHLAQGQLEPNAAEPRWQSDAVTHSSRRDIEQAVRAAETGLATEPDEAFRQARPTLPLYTNLRHAYIQLRERIAHGEGWQSIAAGASLRPDAHDPRVPALRQRLGIAEPTEQTSHADDAPSRDENTASPAPILPQPDPQIYDPTLVKAVRQFQRNHYLEEDGIVGRATLTELNIPIEARLEQLRINLERARWLAREMEPHMVLVDIAGAQIFYYRNNLPEWRTRAQVGTSARATPLIKSQITHFTFNPTWTVPPTILRKDKLPRIRQNLDYLRRNNYRVLDTDGNELSPDSIDWDRPGAIMLRQDSGPGNALGRVAIRFPNPNAVYLHDTPSQRLFDRGQRTFSSGCVRVENALDLVGRLIHDAGNLDDDAIQRILDSGRMRNINLSQPVPLLMGYWTADADDAGEIRYRPDIYRHDTRLSQTLSKSLRAIPPFDCMLPETPAEPGH